MIKSVTISVVALALVAVAAAPSKAAAAQTCGQQARHSALPRAQADAAGRACVLGGHAAPPPSSVAEVSAILKTAITPKTGFVVNPPSDIEMFCPKYADLPSDQRAKVWRNLFLALVPVESSFKNDSMQLDGDQYSIGLFQMSMDNGCAVKRDSDLLDPKANTTCAVKKMNQLATPGPSKTLVRGLIGGDAGHLKDGAAHYWKTLRITGVMGGASHPSRQAIISATMATVGCT